MNDSADRPRPNRVDVSRAHSARVWNYWLGGKDHFAIDRQVGDQIEGILPSITAQARADRIFHSRVVRYLADRGVRQFLDIGVGYPTANNTHQIAQRIRPGASVVYVDNDPVVIGHARALLTSSREGTCAHIEADLHEPHMIIAGARQAIDFSRPVAVLLIGVLHHITETADATDIVHRLKGALSAGSYLAISHATNAVHGRKGEQAAAHWNTHVTPPICLRSPEQITGLFDGLELVEPGVVSCSQWPSAAYAELVDAFCGLGKKVTP